MGGGGAVANVAVADGTDKNFVDGGDYHLSKGLVGAIVRVEDFGGNVMGVAKVGDLGARIGSWDSGIGAGANHSDEISCRYCCVHGGGDSELK